MVDFEEFLVVKAFASGFRFYGIGAQTQSPNRDKGFWFLSVIFFSFEFEFDTNSSVVLAIRRNRSSQDD